MFCNVCNVLFFVLYNNQQPVDEFGDNGCICADNKNNGKWGVESCDSKHPFICAHVEKDDEFFTCKLKSQIFLIKVSQ